ncbi:MAG: hypothetical protein M1457_10320 [bacterium]|nr:hypothetical protein [bacterium]
MLHKLAGVFASLNENKVRYLVMGGIAAVLHGVPRATFDLDILIDPDPDNANRLLRALTQAGLATATLIDSKQLLDNEITVFSDFVRIDVQTRTPGIHFADAWERRDEMCYGQTAFTVLSKKDTIASKRAAGRPVDLDDVRILENGNP